MIDYFSQVDPPVLESQLELLAKTLKKIPRKKEAILAYKELLSRFNLSTNFTLYISQYMDLIYYFKDPTQIYENTLNSLKLYPTNEGKRNQKFKRYKASQRNLLLKSSIQIEKLAELEEINTQKLSYFTLALKLYKKLLDEHQEDSDEKRFATMRVAELSAYDFKQWQSAVNYYLKLSEITKDKLTIKESMYKAILAAEELMASQTGRNSPMHLIQLGLTEIKSKNR